MQSSEKFIIPLDGNLTWEEMQDQIFYAILEECSGCRTWTAKRLGVALRTVRNRIKRLEAKGIKVPDVDKKILAEAKLQRHMRLEAECQAKLEKDGYL